MDVFGIGVSAVKSYFAPVCSVLLNEINIGTKVNEQVNKRNTRHWIDI